MLFYYNIFFFLTFLFITPNRLSKNFNNFFWVILFFFFVIIIGLRLDVSGDWQIYRENFYSYGERNLFNPLDLKVKIRSDYLYELLSWIVYNLDLEYYFVTLVCALIFTFGLFKFCIFTRQPILSLIIACPYLIFIIAMGYTRQSVAISLIMISLIMLLKDKYYWYLFLIITAVLFHKVAIIMVTLIYLVHTKNFFIQKFFVIPFFFSIIIYLLSSDFKFLLYYLSNDNTVTSGGALYRYFLQLIPSILYLYYRNILSVNINERKIFTFFSIISILIIYFVLFYSTAADRLLLYFIPLQILVFSRLSLIFYNQINKSMINFLIVLYFLIQLIFWFNFSYTSFAWTPYNNYLFLIF